MEPISLQNSPEPSQKSHMLPFGSFPITHVCAPALTAVVDPAEVPDDEEVEEVVDDDKE
jgi:hypothetical protein